LPVAVACCHCTLLLAIDILNTHQCSPLTIAFAHYPCRCECKFFTCDDESMWTGLWEQEHFWLSLVKFFYGDQTARLFFSACLLSIFFKWFQFRHFYSHFSKKNLNDFSWQCGIMSIKHVDGSM
jgi:hypothetical protein